MPQLEVPMPWRSGVIAWSRSVSTANEFATAASSSRSWAPSADCRRLGTDAQRSSRTARSRRAIGDRRGAEAADLGEGEIKKPHVGQPWTAISWPVGLRGRVRSNSPVLRIFRDGEPGSKHPIQGRTAAPAAATRSDRRFVRTRMSGGTVVAKRSWSSAARSALLDADRAKRRHDGDPPARRVRHGVRRAVRG